MRKWLRRSAREGAAITSASVSPFFLGSCFEERKIEERLWSDVAGNV